MCWVVGGLFTLLLGGIWIGKRDGTPRLLVSSVPAQEVKQTMPPTPRYTLQDAWVQLDASLVEHWVNGETEVELDLLDMGRVKLMVTQREVVSERLVILIGHVKGQAQSRVTLSVAGAPNGDSFEAMAGTVTLESGRTFRIDYVGNKLHRLSEVSHEVADYCEPGPQSAGVLAGIEGEVIPLVYQRVGLKSAPPSREHQTSGKDFALERMLPHLRVRAATRSNGQRMVSRSWRVTLRLPRRMVGLPQVPAESGVQIPPAVNQPIPSGAPSAPPSSVDSLDMLILYTQEAARVRGGEAGVRALAGLAVGHVNEAFQNSGVQASLRLVAVEPWLHQSTGDIGGDVRAMALDTGIAALRARHNADLVAGFVGGRAQGTVGVGSLLMNPAGQPQACWSVVRAESVGAPFYTFAHEIGHNLGCNHAADQGAGAGAFSYSHGWRFIGGNGQKYRTLLSYQRFPNERRIPYFSNPHLRYERAAVGATMADNARTINQTVATVARYR